MAGTFEEELSAMLKKFTPAGGFGPPGGYGIPNVGGIASQYGRESSESLRRALEQQRVSFDRMGFGRSVGKAFGPATQNRQASQALMDALTRLYSQHGQLAGQQYQTANNQYLGLLGQLAPIAQERANRPSWISSLLGGALGLGAQAIIPGAGGNPLLALLMKQLQSGGGQGGYYGGANTGNFNLGYTPQEY